MGRESKPADVITREYTINLGKAITGVKFKKRAPRAVAEVRSRPRALARDRPRRDDRRCGERGGAARWKRVKGNVVHVRARLGGVDRRRVGGGGRS